MIRLKLFVDDSASKLNTELDKWVDEKKPIIIKTKKMKSGYYHYEILVTYDDNKDGVKL